MDIDSENSTSQSLLLKQNYLTARTKANLSSQKRISYAIFGLILTSSLVFYCYSSVNLDNFSVKEPYLYDLNISKGFLFGSLPKYSFYLIDTDTCKIPAIDPFSSEIEYLIKKKSYKKCQKLSPLVRMTKSIHGAPMLRVDGSVLAKYRVRADALKCCLHYVNRSPRAAEVDEKVKKSDCIEFKTNVTIAEDREVIYVKCMKKVKKKWSTIYEDAFGLVRKDEKVIERMKSMEHKRSSTPWNIIIFGIDSLSRTNLIRTMPKTAAHLQREKWLDFRAFQKIADNTYPNLMALLTGMNRSKAIAQCEPQSSKRFSENCAFIWNDYHDNGYATAYAEDFIPWDTFGMPNHKGFNKIPTDHYLKPLFLLGEEHIYLGDGFDTRCVGSKTTGEHIIKYTADFADRYISKQFFGFFWANSYSHHDFNVPRIMDEKVTSFLEDLKKSGVMNNTFVIFLGDHGVRFGDIRTHLTGHYEVRLPALYISVPEAFKVAYPSAFNSLEINQKRLVTAYDMYLTLRNILSISLREPFPISKGCDSCPLCHSLFDQVSPNRTCDDVSVNPFWCTCDEYIRLSNDHEMARKALDFFVDSHVDQILSEVNKGCRLCANLKVSKILSMYGRKTDGIVYFLCVFALTPGDKQYEALIKLDTITNRFEVLGSDIFSYYSAPCVKSFSLKKFCFCNTKKNHKPEYGKLC